MLEQGYVWRGLTVSNLQRVRVGARLRMARFNCFKSSESVGARLRMARFNCFKSSESTCCSKVTYGEV